MNLSIPFNNSSIIHNKTSVLNTRNLYNELSKYINYLLSIERGSEALAPNKDISLKINKILLKYTNNILLSCPSCKKEIFYGSLENNYIDSNYEFKYNKLLNEFIIFEKIIHEIYDYLLNKHMFELYNEILDICINNGYSISRIFKYLLEKEHLKTIDYNKSGINNSTVYVFEEISKICLENNILNELKLKADNYNNYFFDRTFKFVKLNKENINNNCKYYQTLLGQLFKVSGCGIDKIDINKCVSWLTKAVNNNHIPAYNILGYICLNGYDIVYNNICYKDNLLPLKEINNINKSINDIKHSNLTTKVNLNLGDYYNKDYIKQNNFYNNNTTKNNQKVTNYIVEKDVDLSLVLFKKGAEFNNSNCISNLAWCYQNNLIKCKDNNYNNNQMAFLLYQKAALIGNMQAMGNLGYCYKYGVGVQKNIAKCIYWFNKGSEKGDSYCLINLGYCYISNYGIDECIIIDNELNFIDYVQRLNFINNSNALEKQENNKACTTEFNDSEKKMGNINSRINLNISACSKDLVNKLSADKINNIDKSYIESINANNFIIKNKQEFIKVDKYLYYIFTSINNYKYKKYDKSIKTNQNLRIAFILFKKASEKECPYALNITGYCYEFGLGTDVNLILAFNCYKKAAEKGHVISMLSLGLCYYFGKGTTTSIDKSLNWIKQASIRGSSDADYALYLISLNI